MTDANIKCSSCNCAVDESVEAVDVAGAVDSPTAAHEDYHTETQFAVLLALVPAMTMSLFNMMGLL